MDLILHEYPRLGHRPRRTLGAFRGFVLALALASVGTIGVSAEGQRPARTSKPTASVAPPFAFPSGGISGSTHSFVMLSLPRNVSIALPRAWRTLGPDELQLIGTTTGAITDLSGIDLGSDTDHVLVAANSMPSSTYAAVRVTSTTPPSVTAAEVREMAGLVGYSSKTNTQLAELETDMRAQMENALARAGMRITQFYGVRVDLFGKYPALVTEYKRTGPKGDVFVQINQILTPTHDVQLNLSYRESERMIWMPVMGRIRQSLQVR